MRCSGQNGDKLECFPTRCASTSSPAQDPRRRHAVGVRSKRIEYSKSHKQSIMALAHKVLDCEALPCSEHNALVKESLHNAVRHMISLARAVCCVAFLAKALAIGRKNTPCSPSRSDCHSLATVGQRILKDVDQARRYAQACLSVIAIRRQQLDWVRLRSGVVAFGWWSLLR